jgi:carbamate kinase
MGRRGSESVRIVVALGGNALLKRGEPMTLAVQRGNARVAARAIATVAPGNELIVTHGNGPQIGLLALQSNSSGDAPLPLDVLNAETDGMIGYLLEQELMNCLGGRRIATLLTQVEVHRADPAFGTPTKFIGPQYALEESRRIAAAHGWTMSRDGDKWRRVVASPAPRDILEISAVRTLVSSGFVTICAGGGGIPVARAEDGSHQGVECVVDKDLTSALLAEQLGADCLLLLTDVAAAFQDFGKPMAREIRQASPAYLEGIDFPAGSMGPKIQAACQFARRGGRACIGKLDEVQDILAGRAGTTVSTRCERTVLVP